MDDVSDESVMDIEKRKFYMQSYNFTLMGFLIDENEFEVKTAVSRSLLLMEVSPTKTKRRVKKNPPNPHLNSYWMGWDLNFYFCLSQHIKLYWFAVQNRQILQLYTYNQITIYYTGLLCGQPPAVRRTAGGWSAAAG